VLPLKRPKKTIPITNAITEESDFDQKKEIKKPPSKTKASAMKRMKCNNAEDYEFSDLDNNKGLKPPELKKPSV
jgi:hypothetical protein